MTGFHPFRKKTWKNWRKSLKIKSTPPRRGFFGSEWTPGVDNDPHLFVLYAKGIGSSVAGYFSSTDAYLPVVREFSNGHEMFLLNADVVDLDEEFTYGVLAHEFQHMIHWRIDRNEETWLNEGLSNLAMLINGFSTGRSERIYLKNPDLQLNDWPSETVDSAAHYGASFLFTAYFLDRFGDQATQALVAHSKNGFASIDQVLLEQEISDATTGKILTADDVFRDWAITNYLQNEKIGDGRYGYRNLPSLPQPAITDSLRNCPAQTSPQRVSQYGVDYIQIRCQGDHTLIFDGATQTPVLPTDPYSGSYAFYSNTGEESDMTLTRSFDFSQHQGNLTLTYWTWYDLEKDYDYVYLMASPDGQNWEILNTPSGKLDNPSGNSYGWAYNGKSGDNLNEDISTWIQESVDLSQFAGQQVQLRFEYLTDAAVNGEGFYLDDIAIPEIDYFTDFEQDTGGWQGAGFVRI